MDEARTDHERESSVNAKFWREFLYDFFHPPMPWWMFSHNWAVVIDKWWDGRRRND